VEVQMVFEGSTAEGLILISNIFMEAARNVNLMQVF
jgi:hypothetical protein